MKKIYALLLFCFVLQMSFAQKAKWSLSISSDFFFPSVKDLNQDIEPFELDPSTGFSVITIDPTALYDYDYETDSKPGFSISSNVAFQLSEKVEYIVGAGLSWRSFILQTTVIDDLPRFSALDSLGIIKGTPFVRRDGEPGAGGVLSDEEIAFYSTVNENNRILYFELIPSQVHIKVLKDKLSLFSGLKLSLTAWSEFSYNNYYHFFNSVNSEFKKDHSGSVFNNTIFRFDFGLKYQISPKIAITSAFYRSLTNVYHKDTKDVDLKWNTASFSVSYSLR